MARMVWRTALIEAEFVYRVRVINPMGSVFDTRNGGLRKHGGKS